MVKQRGQFQIRNISTVEHNVKICIFFMKYKI